MIILPEKNKISVPQYNFQYMLIYLWFQVVPVNIANLNTAPQVLPISLLVLFILCPTSEPYNLIGQTHAFLSLTY